MTNKTMKKLGTVVEGTQPHRNHFEAVNNLRELNGRLACYLNRVTRLENENNQLRIELLKYGVLIVDESSRSGFWEPEWKFWLSIIIVTIFYVLYTKMSNT